MRTSKKLLSLLLAFAMLVSVFTVMASAAPYDFTGTIDDGKINYKFTVEKVASTPADEENGLESYVGDDIYAVTVWAKCDEAISSMQIPVHFNKTHFSPIMMYDGEDLYVGNDTYVTDMGEATCYTYTYGDFMKNTGAYKADGSTATTKANAKCIGMGHAKWGTPPQTDIQYMAPDHDLYSVWHKTLTDEQGVMKVQLLANTVKNAFLNTVSGINQSTDWVNLVTIYFQRNAGVTDDDCVGDVFGVTTTTCFGVDGVTDLNAGYYESAIDSIVDNPVKNIVSNATVTKSISLTEKGAQIRFDRNTDGSYANTFDVRTRATIADADFNSLFSSNDDAETKIVKVGFVYADVAKASFSIDDAKAVAQGTAKEGYTDAPVDYIQDCDGYYMFTCLVEDVPQADISNPLTTYAYMGIDTNGDGTADQWIFYTDATSVSFQTLYDIHYASAATKYGW